MIGILIRELTYLKILQPIILEFIKIGIPYNLYLFDGHYFGEKEYNRPSPERIRKSSEEVLIGAQKVKSVRNDSGFLNEIIQDKISKLVSIEIFLWAKNYLDQIKNAGIKIYNILYLCDSMWGDDQACITKMDRIYYMTPFLQDLCLGFLKLNKDPERDRCLGSPVFDCFSGKTGSNVLVLLPNMRSSDVNASFGNESNFISIIKNLAKNNNLIFKARQKQYIPSGVKKIASEIFMDGDVMYPLKTAELFEKTHTTVMFFSSGIYEAVRAGQYVVNIPLPIDRWSWNQVKLEKYLTTEPETLYNFDGVVESVRQDDILQDRWTLKNNMNLQRRDLWLKRYVGEKYHSSQKIATDILK